MSPETRCIWHFADPPPESPADAVETLGGKGAALGRMTRAGLPVPAGFTISTEVCRIYQAAGQAALDSLRKPLREAVARIEQETGRPYAIGRQPLLLAIRGGARYSMPGMMVTLLNCGLTRNLVLAADESDATSSAFAKFIADFARCERGIDLGAQVASAQEGAARWQRYLERYEQLVGHAFPSDPWRQLELAIRFVFESWNSRRAAHYRRLRGIDDRAGTAVNVQAMFPAQLSGLLFSQDPLNRTRNAMIVEYVTGLGDQLAAGRQTPRRLAISRGDLASDGGGEAAVRQDSDHPGETSCDAPPLLSPVGLHVLSELGVRLEQEFRGPVDVEWGCQDGRFALFQARLLERQDETARRDACVEMELARLKNVADEGVLWVRHNLAETAPAPTPLTWDILRRFMSGAGGFGRLYRDLGYAPSRRACRDGFLDLVFGRIYALPGRVAEMFCAGLPLSYDMDRLRQNGSLLERAPNTFDANATDNSFLPRVPHIAWVLWRAARRTKRMMRSADQRFEQRVVPDLESYLEVEQGVDLERLDTHELLRCLDERRAKILDRVAVELLKPGLFGGLAFARVEDRLVRILGQKKGSRVARTLVEGLEVDWRCGPDAWLEQAAEAEVSLSPFLKRYGHRAPEEMELATPRWREEPADVEHLLGALRAGRNVETVKSRGSARKRRTTAEARLPQMLGAQGGGSFLTPIQQDLAVARQLLPYREIGKHYLMMGYDLIRQVIQALGRRLDLGTDIYFLTLDELHQCVGSETTAGDVDCGPLIEQRRLRWQTLQKVPLPDVVDSNSLDGLLQQPAPVEGDGWIAATALSNGLARGPAHVADDIFSMAGPRTGYVLVCRAIDPGLTPLLLGACGLVVEQGGILSHGAVVARQLGIPAVACSDFRQRLGPAAGAVVVDGSRGRVMVERV